MSFKLFILTTVVQLLAWFGYYFLMGGDSWLVDKLKEIIFASVIFILVSLLGGITFLFRPLIIKVEQNNIMKRNMKETVIDIQDGDLKTLQNQRTVAVTIILEKRGSIWWKLFQWLLINHKVYLSVYSTPSNVALQPEEISNLRFSSNANRGFNIRLDNYFLQLFNLSEGIPIEERHEYLVVFHPDFYFPVDATIAIEPIIYVEHNSDSATSKLFGWVLKLLLKKEIEAHKLNISKR